MEYRQYIIRKHKIEWHRKIAIAFACIILFLIGAPLGAIIRKGGFGMPVMVSVFFFVFYHVINIIGEKAAKEATLSVTEGMWLANFVFLPIAIILLYNISKENTNFDLSSYISLLRASVLSSGLIFELPILIFFLTKIGLVTPNFLRKNRKYSLVIVLSLAAIITPPDIASQIIVTIPIIILYELSIFISNVVYKKQQKDIVLSLIHI